MKNYAHLLALGAVCLVAAASSRAQAQGALSCGYDAGASQIHCTANADLADVTEIVLNNGDCYMLPPPAADLRQRYLAQAANTQPLSDTVENRLEWMVSSALDFMRQNDIPFETQATQGGSTVDEYLSNIDAMNEGMAPAIVYFLFNPVKKYHRGETFRVMTNKCSIWKWTITVNGRVYDWNVDQ